MSDALKDYIKFKLADGQGHKAKELVKSACNAFQIKPRTVEYALKELKNNNKIETKPTKPYPLYFLKIDNIQTSHNLYMAGIKKGRTFFSQDEITDLIEKNYTSFVSDKNEIKKNYEEIISTILSYLYWYKKLVFAELSLWLGNSSSQRTKVSHNKILIEKYLLEIFNAVRKTDFNLWHNMAHAIHDVIDMERILTPAQWKALMKY